MVSVGDRKQVITNTGSMLANLINKLFKESSRRSSNRQVPKISALQQHFNVLIIV